MSRIGAALITIPEGVEVTINESSIVVKGQKGELKEPINQKIKVEKTDNIIKVSRSDNSKQSKSLHGLTRALIFNMVKGVTEGFEKTLEMVGTGYRVKKSGQGLTLSVGYSHDINIEPIEGITLEIEGNNIIKVQGISKHLVGQVSANIREVKKPEPYKGKGIRYQDEHVRRKAGKAVKAAGA